MLGFNELKQKSTEIFRKMQLNDVASAEDFEILYEYFQYHPKVESKFGEGVSQFKMVRNFFNNCLAVVRIDGSFETISINFSKTINKKNQIIKAFRHHTIPEMLKFRETINFGIDICPFTNKILELHNTHIDHYEKDFAPMLSDFLKINSLTIDILYPKIIKNGVLNEFTDTELVKNFIQYHNNNCKLRAINKTHNLKRPKMQNIILN